LHFFPAPTIWQFGTTRFQQTLNHRHWSAPSKENHGGILNPIRCNATDLLQRSNYAQFSKSVAALKRATALKMLSKGPAERAMPAPHIKALGKKQALPAAWLMSALGQKRT
jgi:hypothetical protein